MGNDKRIRRQSARQPTDVELIGIVEDVSWFQVVSVLSNRLFLLIVGVWTRHFRLSLFTGQPTLNMRDTDLRQKWS